MLRRLRDRCTRLEGGFALIELLVVILIIGILAAIAIPAYSEHTKKGHDTEAKENVRNLASQVEFCFAPNENFQDCDTAADLDPVIGVPYGTDPGEAYVKSATETTYVIEAVSKAKTGSNHVFTLERNINGTSKRSCIAGPGNSKGACNGGEW